MNQNLSVPIAIVIAGVFIAGALFFAGQNAAPLPGENGGTGGGDGDASAVSAISDTDHILGNPDADIVIVEYSDIECPFCKQFHVTMKQIIDEYGESGQVAWVYRHFPLSQIHPNAPALAEASECVAELGGNSAFWSFLDEIFAVAPGNARFPLGQLEDTVSKVGVNTDAFNSCIESERHRAAVEAEFNNAIATGGQGTPHNVVITKDGQTIALPGAQPYATVKNVIDTILAEQGHSQ